MKAPNKVFHVSRKVFDVTSGKSNVSKSSNNKLPPKQKNVCVPYMNIYIYMFDEDDAHQNQVRDLELGSEGKTCLCCGKSKKVKITDAAIKVESETCWVSSEQVLFFFPFKDEK